MNEVIRVPVILGNVTYRPVMSQTSSVTFSSFTFIVTLTLITTTDHAFHHLLNIKESIPLHYYDKTWVLLVPNMQDKADDWVASKDSLTGRLATRSFLCHAWRFLQNCNHLSNAVAEENTAILYQRILTCKFYASHTHRYMHTRTVHDQ